MANRILVVDDEKLIVKGLRFSLEQDGMEVDCAYDGQEAIDLAKREEYDVVLLDVMLPVFDGFEVCQQIREFSDMPIIMITAKSDDMDKILGLDMGADDYITKPFNILEVKARIKAIIRRNAKKTKASEQKNILKVKELTVDKESRRVWNSEKELNLTGKEFDLLELLLTNPGKVYSREKLLNIVWGYEYPGDVRTVDVHVRRLREKVEANPSDPQYVYTKWGVGYFSRDKKNGERKQSRFKSLRLVWFVILVLFGTMPVLIVNRVVYTTSTANEVQSRIARIQNQWMIVANQVSKSGYVDNPQNEVIDSELEQMARLQDGRVIVVNKNFRTIKDTYKVDDGKYNISEAVLQCFSGETKVNYRQGNRYLDFAQPIYGADNTEVVGVMLLSSSTSSLDELAEKLAFRMRLLEIIEIVIIVTLSVVLSGWMVRPFKRITAALNHATENPLSEEIRIDNFVETRRVSEAYNKTLKQLKRLDESRQQFVSNVSHELKTPITSIRVLADSLIGQEEVPVELYREFMSDISEEIDRESQIIEDLLSLVRLDRSSTELNIAQTNINELLEGTLKRLRPIARQKNVDLILESFRPVLAEVDKMKFTLAISNLVENAIKYNNRDGWVKVSLNADHKFFYVKVADNGIGIPGEAQEHVFERFFRVDKARSREAGGTGLGLAITKSIVYSHHGAIKLYSREDEGTTFTVRVPLIYIA